MAEKRKPEALGSLREFFKNMFGSDTLPLLPKVKAADLEYPLWRFPIREGRMALGWADGPADSKTGLRGSIKGVDSVYRSTHFYAVGASGSGKSKFLESLVIQDIIQNEGFGVIDPHGDLIADIKGWLYFWSDKDFKKDIVLIDPSDPENTASFNPLEPINGIPPERLAGQLVEAFKKIWADAWGERMADIMRNSLIALAENNLTLLELPLLLTEPEARKKILQNVKSVTCRQRFKYFESLSVRTWREWMESTLNKVDAFLSDPAIRQIFASPQSSFNLRDIMDNKKILLVNLNKGKLGDSANLLGALLVSKIKMAAFSRNELAVTKRQPFYLYIDEFQNFATNSFIEILSEARKYKLSLILAHQNLSQLSEDLRDSILANCGIQACFRVNREDAQLLARELLGPMYRHMPGWEMNIQNLQELPPQCCFVGNKAEYGVIGMRTLPVPYPWEWLRQAEDDWDEETFQSLMRKIGIGADYVRNRDEIELESVKRTKDLMVSEGMEESFKEAKNNTEA
jgi:hypothetical protein